MSKSLMFIGITVQKLNDNSNYSFTARLFGKNFRMNSDRERIICYPICEYTANAGQCDVFINGRCYSKRDSYFNWYGARNKCLEGGGDLATFETLNDTDIIVSLKNLSLSSVTNYCIGLQLNEWRWEDTDSAIKYTNWSVYSTFKYNQQCLCLTQNDWKWIECDCSEPYPFICLLKDMPDSSTQVTQGTSTSAGNSETIQFIILGVSCAVMFVVIIIIISALIRRKRRSSDTPRALRSSGYVTPKHTVTESSMDFPVYEEIIQNPKETNKETNIPASDTTYASVVRKVVAKTGEEEHPVNSIVYAELDLKSNE